jgi:hypothetical protein
VTKPQRALVAVLFGVAITAIGKLPVLGTKVVWLPGILVAKLFGGSVYGHGQLSEKTTMVIIVMVSIVAWAAVAYVAFRVPIKKGAA